MTLKTLLLGSAAAFAVAGGAQAADLSVSEPVESVKVCDAFGVGYWYIPGTDTCLKISGEVNFNVNITPLAGSVTGHSSNWDFSTNGELFVDATTMTDVGKLQSHIGVSGTYSGLSSTGVILDGMYISLGGVLMGHTGEVYKNPGSYMDDFGINGYTGMSPNSGKLGDVNQIQLSGTASGFAWALAIADPSDVWGSLLPPTWSMPLVEGNISVTQAAWSGFLSAGAVQLSSGTAYGIDGALTFNIGANDNLRLNAAYGNNGFVGGTLDAGGENNAWSAFASWRHVFTKTVRLDVDAAFIQPGTGMGPSAWQAGADLVWLPYTGFKAKIGAVYMQPSVGASSWAARITARRDFD